MAYQVLARKYRPQRFADVAGQDHVTRTLSNALTQNRIAHGYIFSGHRGIGKTTIARILAQALNCRNLIGSLERPTAEPCGVCDSCREIRQGNAVDVIEIDAATNRGIDEIRELRDSARYSPSRDRYKVYILDEAHQITDAAFNALLKTLEEPPAHVIFMMATTEPESIPQTIRSRCQHFSFHAVKFDDILAQLRLIAAQEEVTAEDAALALLAEAGDGSMRDALSIMDQAIASAPLEGGRAVLQAEQIRELMGSVPNSVFERFMEAVSAGQSAELMLQLDKLLSAGNSPAALARQLVRYLRNCLMAKLDGENTGLLEIAYDERARAARTSLLFTEDDLTRNLQIVLRTFDDLNYRQEQRFHLELGLLKLIQAQRLLPMEEILSGLAGPGGARRPGSGTASSGAPASRPVPASVPASGPAPASRPAPAAPSLSPFAASTQRHVEVSANYATDAPSRPASQSFDSTLVSSRVSTLDSNEAVESFGSVPNQVGPGFSSVINSRLQNRASAPEVSQGLTAGAPALSATEDGPDEAEPAPEIIPEAGPRIVPPPVPPVTTANESSDSDNLDEIRAAVADALNAGGHATAAVLIEDAKWSLDGSSVRIEVNARPAMLRITFNNAAEKLIRQGLSQAGAPTRFLLVPGEGNGGMPAGRPRAIEGSIDAEARSHPLVLRAQELFRAEICTVVDLREK